MDRTRIVGRLALLTLFLASFGGAVHAQPGASDDKSAEEAPQIGLQAGELAPDFTLTSAAGEEVSFGEDILVNGWTILVTYRGGWCPYCNTHIKQLVDRAEAFAEAGAQVVLISIDKPESEQRTIDTHQVPFLVLSDPKAEFLAAYHLLNALTPDYMGKLKEYGIDLHAHSGNAKDIVAHPAVIIVDPEGIIRFFHVNPDYTQRLAPEVILEELTLARAVWAQAQEGMGLEMEG